MSDVSNEQQPLNLPRERYETIVSRPVELDALGIEVTLNVFDIHGDHVIQTCYGDICKIVNALRDYSKLLEMACDEWGLDGWHLATYEYHAEKLREIAGKFQAGIGYDYDAAVEKCKKRAARKTRGDEPGGEALAMGFLKSKRAAEAKDKKAVEGQTDRKLYPADDVDSDSLWEDDL